MTITLKHKILKRLREERTIPLDVMPERLGISLEDYTKLESADSVVKEEFAHKLAGIFNKNWSVFLLNTPPKKLELNNDNRTKENKSPTISEKTFTAIEDANFIIDFSATLEEPASLKIQDYDKIKNKTASELGTLLREQSGISIDEQKGYKSVSAAFKQWVEYVENKGIFVSQHPLDEQDNIRAFSLFKNNKAIIVLKTTDTFSGRIFSLLHEYCHILRRNSGFCDLHHSNSKSVETYCNSFAAAFLVPTKVINGYIKSFGTDEFLSNINEYVNTISKELKVSNIVIFRRLLTMGIINNEQYAEMHKKYITMFKKKPSSSSGDGGPDYYKIRMLRNGASYSNNIIEAHASGELTFAETANALGVKATNLTKYIKQTSQYAIK